MPQFDDHHEESAFYNHGVTDRDAAVSLCAIVDNRLTDLLKTVMRPDTKVSDELFGPSGTLGDFGARIRLAYMLGLFEQDFMQDLKVVAKIRNAFAHDVAITDFAKDPIAGLIGSLKAYHVHRNLYKDKQRSITETSDFNDKVMVTILEGELTDHRSQFHMCIRYYINSLIKSKEVLLSARSRPMPE